MVKGMLANKPRTNRRWVFNVDDYLMLRGQRSRLAQCFIHIYRRQKYVFLIANRLEEVIKTFTGESLTGSVLDLEVHKVLSHQVIYVLLVRNYGISKERR